MRPQFAVTCALAALVAFTASPASAQEEAENQPKIADMIRSFEIDRATSDVEVDGVLDEQTWQNATVIDLPYEWYPGDNVEPPVRTDCLIAYDNENLYIAFRAYDPNPELIRGHLMDRDDILSFIQDDHVGVQLDTFNDERQAFQFRVNPLGVQVDATFDDFQGADDFAWDAIWDSFARITDEGYVVEIAIPFQQLRFPAGAEEQTWGFEAYRNYPRDDRHRISSRWTDRGSECTLCMENKVTGFSDLEPGRNIEITPTITGISTDERQPFPDGDFENVEEDAEVGITGRWGFRPNMVLSGTVNPDFSQVEADEAQLAVNNRFALFFPERRPFFLEGLDFFETALPVIFTRTMADPNYGLKLTGKEGKSAIGAYYVEDDITNFLIPGNQGSRVLSLDEESTNAVFRYRHDVGARSTLGVLYTGREADDYQNQVAGVDAFVAFNPFNVMRVQYVSTDTEYPTGLGLPDEIDGDGFFLSYLHQTRNWFFNFEYQDLDEDFRADSGFVPRVDIKAANATLERRFWGTRDTWYRLWTIGAAAERVEAQDGTLTDEAQEIFVTFDGPYQSFGQLTLSNREEFFAGQLFDLDRVQARYQMKPTGDFTFALVVRDGEAIDLTNAQKGDEFLIQPGFEVRIGRHLNWRFDYLRQTLEVPAGDVFDAQIAQTRVVYQFNVRTFLRAIFQYQKVDRDQEVYPFPVNAEREDLLSQLLFSYKINPQTVLFLGYTENGIGTQDFSLTETDRTFFVKVGYAFLY